MNIGIVSTLGIRCGISQYSRSLGIALDKIGCNVTWFGNIPRDRNPQDKLVEADNELPGRIRRWFEVKGWTNELYADFSVFENAKIDVLHIQWESFLYDQSIGPRLLSLPYPIVLTAHSAGFYPGLDFSNVRYLLAHSTDVLDKCPNLVYNKCVIPMGGPYSPPVISTFGLGRSNSETIASVCKELGYRFEVLNWVDWVPMDRLIEELKKSDAIVLFFPPTDSKVSSSSIRVALSTNRPVIVTDTNWFEDLEAHNNQLICQSLLPFGLVPPCVCKIPFERSYLKMALSGIFKDRDKMQKKHSWESVAKEHKRFYSNILKDA